MATDLSVRTVRTGGTSATKLDEFVKNATLVVGLVFESAGLAIVALSLYFMFFWTGGDVIEPNLMIQCISGLVAGVFMMFVGMLAFYATPYLKSD